MEKKTGPIFKMQPDEFVTCMYKKNLDQKYERAVPLQSNRVINIITTYLTYLPLMIRRNADSSGQISWNGKSLLKINIKYQLKREKELKFMLSLSTPEYCTCWRISHTRA